MEDAACHGSVAEAVAGGEGVSQVQGRIVVIAHGGGEAALRPDARRPGSQPRLRQQKYGLRREMKRDQQPGDAAADDDGPVLAVSDLDAHTASIRSTANRAGSAISGATVTT